MIPDKLIPVTTIELPVKTFLTGIAVVIGSGIIRFIEKYFLDSAASDHEKFREEHNDLRDELREELKKFREEVDSLKAEVEEWRQKYYNQAQNNLELREEVSSLRAQLEEYTSNSGPNQLLEPKND